MGDKLDLRPSGSAAASGPARSTRQPFLTIGGGGGGGPLPLPIGNGSLPAQAAKPSTAVNPIAACTNRFMESPSVDEHEITATRQLATSAEKPHSPQISRSNPVVALRIGVAQDPGDSEMLAGRCRDRGVLQTPAMQVRRPE